MRRAIRTDTPVGKTPRAHTVKVVPVRIGTGIDQQRQHRAITSIREYRMPERCIALPIRGIHPRTRRLKRADSRGILLVRREVQRRPLLAALASQPLVLIRHATHHDDSLTKDIGAPPTVLRHLRPSDDTARLA